MKRYVLGFLFDSTRTRVALILKNRPAYQVGQFNGIGGKIEQFDRDPVAAQRREFREEAGLDIDNWEEVFQFTHQGNAHITVFRAFSDKVRIVSSETDEQVSVFPISHLPPNVLPSARMFIHMVLEDRLLTGEIVIDIQPNSIYQQELPHV
jgi:8-oxo-dGTP diphosphatase